MAYRSLTFATIGTIIASCFALVYSALDAFFRAVVLMPVNFDWRTARDIAVASFLKIADLKPVYRESYETHGLSLDARRMHC